MVVQQKSIQLIVLISILVSACDSGTPDSAVLAADRVLSNAYVYTVDEGRSVA